MIIDAHSHLWLKQNTMVDGQPIRTLSPNASRSLFFGEEVQMLPPFMTDGRNTAEVFLSNMDYAQVGGAVVVQEIIDGNQNAYLAEVQHAYPDRFCCLGMATDVESARQAIRMGLRGLALPAHRLLEQSLLDILPVFKLLEVQNLVLSVCLADDERQIGEMAEVIAECPKLRVAVGHFGMPTTASFRQQVMLADRSDRVRIESGGITWLYNAEFYPFPTAVRRIREAADWVGEDKLMWGSDYPRTITAISTIRNSGSSTSKTRNRSQQARCCSNCNTSASAAQTSTRSGDATPWHSTPSSLAKSEVAFQTKLFVQKELDIRGSRNATPQDFRAVIRYLERGTCPTDQLITKVIAPDEAMDTMQWWDKHPGKVFRILVEWGR